MIEIWTGAEPPDKAVRRVLQGEVVPENRKEIIAAVIRCDKFIADGLRGLFTHVQMVSNSVSDDNIYRVGVFPDGIDILCFGLSSIDSDISGHYDQSENLPNWVKERLAVLMITSGTPPTQEVAGIGRRISGHVYWVYAPAQT